MSFFILVHGKVSPYTFEYLDDNSPVRLERTLIHTDRPKGKSKETHESISREVFAIELMSKDLAKLSPAATIKDARKLMEERKISHIPLTIDNLLVGLVSSKDLLPFVNPGGEGTRLDKCMARLVLCASEETPLRHIAEVFLKENINSLPIVDRDFLVTGIITNRDLIRWLLTMNKFQKEMK